jgi:hypothetical protein
MTSQILVSIGTRSAPILVQLSEYEGRRSLDIRRYFHAANGELMPTRKGIALNRETVAILQNTLESESGRIEDWLDPLEGSSAEGRDAERRRLALEAEKFGRRGFEQIAGEWRSPTFFDVSYDGHSDKLRFNRSHQIGRLLDDPALANNTFLLQQLIRMVLITYSRSRALFSGAGTMESEALLDDLEFNWGVILDRYLETSEQ